MYFALLRKSYQPEAGSYLEPKHVVERNNVTLRRNKIINWVVFGCILFIFCNSMQHNGDVWAKWLWHGFSSPIITGISLFLLATLAIFLLCSLAILTSFQLLSTSHLYALKWQCLLTNMFLFHYHELCCPGCEVCDRQLFKDSHSLRQKVQQNCLPPSTNCTCTFWI